MFSSLFYSEFDLYTKSDSLPDLEALTPYYQSLIDKYIPGTVRW
jgi:inositol oxygenase